MKKFMSKVTHEVSKKSPEILIGMSIVGVVSTAVLAVRATPKALSILEDEIIEKSIESEKDAEDITLSNLDKIKLTWKVYAPAVIMGSVTIASIVGSSRVHMKRNAALAGLLTLTEKTLNDYQDKVVEVIGEKKASEVKEAVAKDQISEAAKSDVTVIESKDEGVLFYDLLSGRLFRSTVEKIRAAENDFNSDLFNGYWASLNEFYNHIGLKGIALGEGIGWSANDMLKVDLNTATIAPNGEPCIVLDFVRYPDADFR